MQPPAASTEASPAGPGAGEGAGRYKPRENARSRWLFLELKTCYVIIINSDIKQLIPNSYKELRSLSFETGIQPWLF